MRARFVFEKFTEDDSDPIRDMGIGLVAKLQEAIKRDYNLKYISPEYKDEMRIENIIRKAKGDEGKERMYARNMANAITDRHKAYRRYLAAKAQKGEGWDVTVIFLQRVLEMYGLYNIV